MQKEIKEKVATKRSNTKSERKANFQIVQEPDQNFYLVFMKDDGSPEDCSVFYSELVLARSELGAIDVIAKCDRGKRGSYGAHKVELLIAQDKGIKYDPSDFTSLSDEDDS